jgi:AcrR family transcriptional regulator
MAVKEVHALVDSARKTEILDTAATMFASRGVRTSLQEIAEAAGILPGSLYHHFDSKEAIIVELIERYQRDLDGVAERARSELREVDDRRPRERIVTLATAIASCAVRHRAALMLTFYEPPAGASDEFVRLAQRTPTGVEQAMLETVRAAHASGDLRAGIDVGLLANRLCQSMLHVGIGVSHQAPGGEHVPEVRCALLLDGVAVRTPADGTLQRSRAMRAADVEIDSWAELDRNAGDDRGTLVHAARSEFARRGYGATTVRDVAAAAGLSIGAVYRLIRSKDELLESIMRGYSTTVTKGWDAVLTSDASTVEKLDALTWLNINVLDRFSEEYKIHAALLPQLPSTTPDLGMSFSAQLRKLRTVLAAGLRSGELQVPKAPADMRVRSLFALSWTPENIVRDQGARGALKLARDTVLRGAAAGRGTA